MNKLKELESFLEMVGQTKRRAHFEIDYDGERFHWTVPVRNMTGTQYASLIDGGCHDAPGKGTRCDTSPVGEKEHHGT